MAYADSNTFNRKLGTGAIVLLLEVGLASAVIAGLAVQFDRKTERNPRATSFPLPKEPVKQEPVKTKDPVKTTTQPDRKLVIDLTGDTGPVALPTFTAPSDEGGGIREVIFNPPTPSPVPPRFKPKSARPIGAMGRWVTDNDYPTNDLRQGHEGRTAYSLSIDTSGKVTSCTISASSGWPGLDRATCDKITSRGKFEPATNSDGERIVGSFSSAITWRIPPEE